MSKLNLHWQGTANWMRRVHFSAPYVKLVDPPEDNIFPGKRTIGRVYMSDGEEGRFYGQGAAGGIAYFKRCMGDEEHPGPYRKAPYVWAWESWNEPAVIKTPEERANLDAATVAWANMMHDFWMRVVVGNFSERNPPDGTMPEFAAMLEEADCLGFHCYDAPTLTTHGYVLRYRQLIAELRDAGLRVPPVLLTEVGVDGGVIGMGRKGWQKMRGYDWGDYMADLVWLGSELEKDVDVAGAFVFTAAATGDWRTFNITEKQARGLADRLR